MKTRCVERISTQVSENRTDQPLITEIGKGAKKPVKNALGKTIVQAAFAEGFAEGWKAAMATTAIDWDNVKIGGTD